MAEEENWDDLCNGAEGATSVDDEGDEEMIAALSHAAAVVVKSGRRRNNPRKPNVDRRHQKEVWSNGYRTWDDEQLKSRVRVNRERSS